MQKQKATVYTFTNIPEEYVEYLAYLLQNNPFEDLGHRELEPEKKMRQELFNLFKTESMLTKEDVFTTKHFMKQEEIS